jgi:hypothetical protein
LTDDLAVAILFFEPVVIRELLANLDVTSGKEAEVDVTTQLQHLGVQAGAAAADSIQRQTLSTTGYQQQQAIKNTITNRLSKRTTLLLHTWQQDMASSI